MRGTTFGGKHLLDDTEYHQARRRSTNSIFWPGSLSEWGGGVFHVMGRGPNKRYVPRSPGNQTFSWDIPGKSSLLGKQKLTRIKVFKVLRGPKWGHTHVISWLNFTMDKKIIYYTELSASNYFVIFRFAWLVLSKEFRWLMWCFLLFPKAGKSPLWTNTGQDLKLSENFERHWSIRISGEIHMDQSLVHTFSWGNSYGPMVLKVLLKFPPTLVLVHGWLFPARFERVRQVEENLGYLGGFLGKTPKTRTRRTG